MERQRIRDQIGALEEQLERLREISLSNAQSLVTAGGQFNFGEDLLLKETLEALRGLQDLVQEQSQEKSIPSQDFLKRITSILIREATAAGHEIALSTFGTGRISLDMVEISMGAIMACLRASLKGFSAAAPGKRAKYRLFKTFSVYIELRATQDDVYFRVTDDGPGFRGAFRASFDTEKNFQKIRSHISRFGGWFRLQSMPNYGGSIEFKIPMASGRFECVLLEGPGFQFLIPSSCVAEIRQGNALPPSVSGNQMIAALDEAEGMTTDSEFSDFTTSIRVAVADFQFWIRCRSTGERVKARKQSAAGFVEKGSWLKNFGVFQEQGIAKILPLLEGEALMNFHHLNRSGNESD